MICNNDIADAIAKLVEEAFPGRRCTGTLRQAGGKHLWLNLPAHG